MGRVKDAKSGSEAKGTDETDYTKLPYRQTYSYNAFNNMTLRLSTLWNVTGDWGFGYTLANNRAAGATYDADGRQTGGGEDINFLYDGTGRMSKTWRDLRYETLLYQDGLGNEGKRSQRTWTVPDDPSSSWGGWLTRYFIFSSVLGRNVTEASSTGKKRRTYVIADGTTIARQGIDEGTTTEHVGWEHHDGAGLSGRRTLRSGDSGANELFADEEMDALGNNIGIAAPLQIHMPNKISSGDSLSFTDTDSGAVEVDGILMPGSMASMMLANGSAIPSHLARYQHLPGFSYEDRGFGMFSVTIPDIFQNVHTGRTWTVPHGERGDGERIFTGGTFINSFSWDVSVQQQYPDRALTEREVGVVRNNVDILLRNERCAKFVEDLLNKARELFPKQAMWSDDILGMFDTITNEGGFSFGNTIKKAYGFGGSTVSGFFTRETAGVEFDVEFQRQISPVPGMFTARMARIMNTDRGIKMGVTAIHEIMHLAGFDDEQLAYAVSKLPNSSISGVGIPASGASKTEIRKASDIWGGELGKACLQFAK